MADIYIVTGDKPLWVKKQGSATAEDINVISPGDTITVSEISFGWYHCIGGWVYGFDQDGNSVLSLVSSGAPDNKSTNSLSDPKNQNTNDSATSSSDGNRQNADKKTPPKPDKPVNTTLPPPPPTKPADDGGKKANP